MNADDLGMVVRTGPIMAMDTCSAPSERVGELVHSDVDRVAGRTRRSRGLPGVI